MVLSKHSSVKCAYKEVLRGDLHPEVRSNGLQKKKDCQ